MRYSNIDGCQAPGRKGSRRVTVANKLSEDERQQILAIANSQNLLVVRPQIVPTQANRDGYLTS